MRTPVVLICGQSDADAEAVTEAVAGTAGTVVVRHRRDGHVVVRTVTSATESSDWPLDLVNGCSSCTVREDLLFLLRHLPTRGDVTRIVVRLMPWLEPEMVCWAIDNVRLRLGPGYPDGPAALDVRVDGVVTCLDAAQWLEQLGSDEELDDGRTVAQIVVGQAEFADVLVISNPDADALALLHRLAPRAHLADAGARVETALASLGTNARRGRSDDPYDPLLAGQPPLEPSGEVCLLLFSARRPFHPKRLHDALDLLGDGVLRTRGRLWLANRVDDVMWLESTCGETYFDHAGKWLAAMSSSEFEEAGRQRQALAAADWDDELGDRQVAMTLLTYGAQSERILDGLRAALLTDQELGRPNEWPTYADPFGDWHEAPCDTQDVSATNWGEDR
jgi:G3E family GTPase